MHFVGMSDVAFYEHRDRQMRQDGLEERPGRLAAACGFGSVPVESGGDCVGSSAFGGLGIFESGNIGEDRTVEFGVDAGDEFGPGLGGGKTASGAVQGNDVRSCIGNGLGGVEVWCDVDVAVCVVGLDDADDRELRQFAEGGDPRNPFGA